MNSLLIDDSKGVSTPVSAHEGAHRTDQAMGGRKALVVPADGVGVLGSGNETSALTGGIHSHVATGTGDA
ncbi:MAG: hypothetical protein U1F22_04220 [Lysobacterales bacterium]